MTELETRLASALEALSNQYSADITSLSQQMTVLSQQLLVLQQQVTNSAQQAEALSNAYDKLTALFSEELNV